MGGWTELNNDGTVRANTDKKEIPENSEIIKGGEPPK